MINAAELAILKAEEVSWMPDTAQILRSTPTSSAGGWAATFVQVATTKCRLTSFDGASEPTAAGELASLTRYKLVVPEGTDIRPSDRIGFNGKTFEIQGGLTESSWNMSDDWFLTEILRT